MTHEKQVQHDLKHVDNGKGVKQRCSYADIKAKNPSIWASLRGLTGMSGEYTFCSLAINPRCSPQCTRPAFMGRQTK